MTLTLMACVGLAYASLRAWQRASIEAFVLTLLAVAHHSRLPRVRASQRRRISCRTSQVEQRIASVVERRSHALSGKARSPKFPTCPSFDGVAAYRIAQNIRGRKLSRISRFFSLRESFLPRNFRFSHTS